MEDTNTHMKVNTASPIAAFTATMTDHNSFLFCSDSFDDIYEKYSCCQVQLGVVFSVWCVSITIGKFNKFGSGDLPT
jgi:hypothetical protein